MGSLRWSQEQLDSALKTGGVKISGDRRTSETRKEVDQDTQKGAKSKYGNEKTEVDGIKLDSRKESKRWKELRLMLKGGYIQALGRQTDFILPGGIIYRADFTYFEKNSRELTIEDCKGYLTPEYKMKRKLMLERGYEILET